MKDKKYEMWVVFIGGKPYVGPSGEMMAFSNRKVAKNEADFAITFYMKEKYTIKKVEF